MALQAVCYKCGSLSRGVSPLCANQLCANFGQPARPQYEPTNSNPPLPHTPDRKQFSLRTLAVATTVVAGVVALLVKIPVLAFLLLAYAGLCIFLLLFIRWSLRSSQWIDARPRLKFLVAVLNCCLYLLFAIAIANQAVGRAFFASALIAAIVLLAAIAEGWRAVVAYSIEKRREDSPPSRVEQ